MRKILLAFLLVCAFAMQTSAHEVPDLTRQGSITVTMRYDGQVIPGGKLTLYRVGDICEDDGNYSFILSAEFASSNVSLEPLQSAQTAKALSDYTQKQKVSGILQEIGADGTARYDGLQPGLYLLAQQKAAAGFVKAPPFLVSLPMQLDGNYLYDVDASPKVSPLPEPQPENPETPKTGQSGWPFWAFSLSAMGLFLLTRKRKME